MAAEEQLVARFRLKIGDQPVQAEFALPKGPMLRRQLLPVAQAMTDLVVAAAQTRQTEAGRQISCAAGCGACCRQLVPIAPSEAHQIAALVDELPEPRRAPVRARFAAAARRLAEAGLLESLRHPERVVGEQVGELGLAYFRLGIACPFLEQESCSIHPHRPLACREYLVTSPAACCAAQAPGQVQGVALATKVSRVLRQLDHLAYGTASSWLPMILAPQWAADHPDQPPPRPGPELLREFMERLTGQALSAPPNAARE